MPDTDRQPKRIRIGMILDIDFPPDDRPEKEARSLLEQGYDVYLLSVTLTAEKPLREIYKGIHITRFRMNRSIRKKLSSAYLILPLYRWIWRRQVEKFVHENNIDILHVHDLPLTDIAHEIAAKKKLRVVCDQHEYWSNWIVKTAHYNTIIGRIVKAFSNWKAYERRNLQKADLIITVTEPLRQRYIQDVQIPPDNIVTVPNTPSKNIFTDQNIDQAIVNRYRDYFVLFYAGVMSILRGIDLVIKALPELEKTIPNIRFVMAGRFSRNCNPVQMAEALGVGHLVEYLGWVPVDQIPSYIAASNICVHLPNARAAGEANNTIATKVYQYAAMSKPIIISHAKMMQEFVLNNGLGTSLKMYNQEALIEAVVEFHKNYDEVASRVQASSVKLLKKEELFWEKTVVPMLEYYKNKLV